MGAGILGGTILVLVIGGFWLKYAFVERDKCQARAKDQKNNLVQKYIQNQATYHSEHTSFSL